MDKQEELELASKEDLEVLRMISELEKLEFDKKISKNQVILTSLAIWGVFGTALTYIVDLIFKICNGG